ncbi:MAG TPA: hypothetical protein DCE41_22015 [Cytophagales bacterium]|nr:hypothetical protein [Cytophagales bacterium]HAA21344.1 hypothetical protein [Cytophagales bacterium]HAP58719.1 hypothetical protein [Cytophagales bacterium]
MGLLARFLETKSPEEKLWEWFEGHEEYLIQLMEKGETLNDYDQERLDLLMKRVSPFLDYFFNPPNQSRGWRLVFTVGGKVDAFPAIEALMAVPHQLEHCEALGFSPPMEELTSVTLSSSEHTFELLAKDLSFQVQQEPQVLVNVYVPDTLIDHNATDSVLQFLFEYLGEHQFGLLADRLNLVSASNGEGEDLKPLVELRKGLG